MAHSLQGVYSPLPQSLSDSDSEKEMSMDPICSNYGNNGLKNAKVDNSCRHNGHLSFNMSDEMLKIKRVNPKMSTLRKAAFVLSILLCFLPIVIFLWVLPCSDSNTCPARISNWKNQYDDVELLGKINLVHGVFQNNFNLALMYIGSFNTPNVRNGVMSFLGRNGAVAWYVQLNSYPIEMNCSIIDVSGNGLEDCLVIDEKGLKAIETITGLEVWCAHSAPKESIPELDMPVKLPDFDADGTDELLAVYKKKSFLLISGKTGLALSNIKIFPKCTTVANLTTYLETIRYGCRNSEEVVKTYEVSFQNLKRKYEQQDEDIIPLEVLGNDEGIVYETGNRKLIIDNYGDCPHCRSVISFYNSTTKWTYQNTFVMNPVPFSFRSAEDNVATLGGHVCGFILKIWEWRELSKKLLSYRVNKRSIPVDNATYYLNDVLESIVFVTFNETNTNFMNVSSTEVHQICNGLGHESRCQPDYRNQQDSLLIADLDHDKSKELVSYSSSYTKRDEEGDESWHLMSYLKAFRLEDELPKLYGTQ